MEKLDQPGKFTSNATLLIKNIWSNQILTSKLHLQSVEIKMEK